MPETIDDKKGAPLSFRVPPDMVEMLDSLRGSLHGTTRSDVARNLIRDRLLTIYPKGKIE
jgi:hypothetical protein